MTKQPLATLHVACGIGFLVALSDAQIFPSTGWNFGPHRPSIRHVFVSSPKNKNLPATPGPRSDAHDRGVKLRAKRVLVGAKRSFVLSGPTIGGISQQHLRGR